MDNARIKHFVENYIEPRKTYSLGSPAAVQRDYLRRGKHARLKDIKYALAHTDAYALHREYHKNRVDNPFYIYKKRAMVSAPFVK